MSNFVRNLKPRAAFAPVIVVLIFVIGTIATAQFEKSPLAYFSDFGQMFSMCAYICSITFVIAVILFWPFVILSARRCRRNSFVLAVKFQAVSFLLSFATFVVLTLSGSMLVKQSLVTGLCALAISPFLKQFSQTSTSQFTHGFTKMPTYTLIGIISYYSLTYAVLCFNNQTFSAGLVFALVPPAASSLNVKIIGVGNIKELALLTAGNFIVSAVMLVLTAIWIDS